MKTSADRILTTHAGSLPRPRNLLARLTERQAGIAYDSSELQIAVNDIVRRQRELGIDVVTDGEMSKPNFLTYIDERLAVSNVKRVQPDRTWRIRGPRPRMLRPFQTITVAALAFRRCRCA